MLSSLLAQLAHHVYLKAFFQLLLGRYHDPTLETFNNWSLNGFVLNFLYAGMKSFEQVYLQNSDDIDQFLSTHDNFSNSIATFGSNREFKFSHRTFENNLKVLGLGRFQNELEKMENQICLQLQAKKQAQQAKLEQQQQATKAKKEQFQTEENAVLQQQVLKLQKQLTKIIKNQNIDNTLLYFTLRGEIKCQSDQQFDIWANGINIDHHDIFNKMIKDAAPKSLVEIKPKLKKNEYKTNPISVLQQKGFRGEHKAIENFVIPHYKYTRKYLEVDIRYQLGITIILIFVKIFIPVFILIRPFQILIFPFALIFLGFYLHFISIISQFVTNDDIKTKNYLLKALIVLLDVDDSVDDEENLEKIEAIKKFSLDVSCKISLLAWNNIRHICLLIEQRSQFQNNFTYLFLVLYGKCCLITYLICTAQAFNYISLGDICHEQIIVYNQHIDIVIIGLLCLYRITYGSQFNETFAEIQEKIHRINSVYEDLDTLFDYYFTPGMHDQIENDLYKELVGLIVKNSLNLYNLQNAFKNNNNNNNIQEQEIVLHDSYEIILNLLKDDLDKLKHTMKKISKQVIKDEKKYQEKFLYFYTANFHQAWKIFSLLMVTFIPSLFNKIMKYAGHV